VRLKLASSTDCRHGRYRSHIEEAIKLGLKVWRCDRERRMRSVGCNRWCKEWIVRDEKKRLRTVELWSRNGYTTWWKVWISILI
jgi:hypothetical protein